ncbi:biotin-requiring enzyme [Shuttleworthella sp. MSX8B]|uniref:biotin/lipoyl-containing protein n=1 Tax=Shuttleworthella sp. MSX8B TaxID=936574 RepID=UPI00044F6AB0|nr:MULTISPECIES: biotin/lipoyl-containing protein [Shuttleworthia]EUB17275.1 biotin-requiring enzyme [Shuttleworthia sp. MSX8B]
MKNYTITVNGKSYDVTVEEGAGSASAPRSQAVAAPAAAPAAPVAGSGAGSVRIEAGAAGKVFKLNVPVGTAVKKGDTVLTLEVMKMETPVVAAQDGTVASIEVTEGQQVEAGDLLATMN